MAKLTGEAKKRFLARMARGRKAAAGGAPAKKKAGKKRTKKAAKKGATRAPKKAKMPKGLAAKVAHLSARVSTVEHNDAANQHLWMQMLNSQRSARGLSPINSIPGFKKPRMSLGYSSKLKQLGR